jgi:hypothetical protein
MPFVTGAAFFSAPGFLIGFGVEDPKVVGFLPVDDGVVRLVGVLLPGVVLLASGVLAVVVGVVLGADRGALGLDGVVVPVVFDARLLLVVGRVVDLGVLAVDAELGAVAGRAGVRGVVAVGVVGLGVERCDRGTRGVVVAGLGVLGVREDVLLSAAFLAADAARATLVRVAEGARRGVLAAAANACVLDVDTGVVLALEAVPGAVDVFVIVLDVVAVDILVVGVDGVGFCAARLVVLDAADGIVLVVDDGEGLVGVVVVVGLAVLALNGCLVEAVGVDRVDGLGGLVVADLADAVVVLADKGVRFFASVVGSGFFAAGVFALASLDEVADFAAATTAAPVAATAAVAATAVRTSVVLSSAVFGGSSVSADDTADCSAATGSSTISGSLIDSSMTAASSVAGGGSEAVSTISAVTSGSEAISSVLSGSSIATISGSGKDSDSWAITGSEIISGSGTSSDSWTISGIAS